MVKQIFSAVEIRGEGTVSSSRSAVSSKEYFFKIIL